MLNIFERTHFPGENISPSIIFAADLRKKQDLKPGFREQILVGDSHFEIFLSDITRRYLTRQSEVDPIKTQNY